MRRRSFIGYIACGLAAPTMTGFAAPGVSISGPLAGSLYFTRDQPGIWASEAARHLPRIGIDPAPGGTTGITITTPHPMDACRHYIVKHKLLDARLRLISQKQFDPQRDQPVSRHVLPAGYAGAVYAVSICNLHDAWIEGAMIVASEPPG